MSYAKSLAEMHDIIEEMLYGMLHTCAGEAGGNINGPNKIEKLALAGMDRIKADIKAGKFKYSNINPLVRPSLVAGLELAISNKLLDTKRLKEVQSFLKKLRNQEKAEELAMYGYVEDDDDEWF